jgi:glycosyltransferase involved in cell wall biosynthesis
VLRKDSPFRPRATWFSHAGRPQDAGSALVADMDELRTAGPPPIRVLLLHRDLTYHGGVSRMFLTTAGSIDRGSLSVEIASLQEAQPEMCHSFGELGVPVHVIGDRSWVLPTLRLRRILLKQRLEVTVCGSLKAYITAKAATWGSRKPVLFWLPGTDCVISGRFRRLVFRLLASKDPLIFTSRVVQRAHGYARHVGAEYVLPNGVSDPLEKKETTPYPREFRANLNIPHDACVIGYTAQFVELKDHGTLLSGFQLVLRRHPNAHLILIGTGRLLDAVTKKAAGIDPAGHVHLLGPRVDARRLLGIMDIYAHPCMWEGFGLAAVEAMLAGVPVVAANSGALPEIVENEVTGVLFRPQDSGDLAACISRLVSSPTLSRQVSLAARAHSLREFSPRLFCSRLEAILRKEVFRNGAGPGKIAGRRPTS